MKTKDLVMTSLFMAIVFVLSLAPQLGFIELGPVSVTIIHIPVIIGAIFLGKRSGLLIGLAFGLGSFMNSMTSPVLFAPVFANPLVSILPRIVFGFGTYYIYSGVKSLFKSKTISYGVTAGLATLFHSLMVVPLLFYFGMNHAGIGAFLSEAFGGNVLKFIVGIFVANSFMEIAAATILTPIVLTALNKIQR